MEKGIEIAKWQIEGLLKNSSERISEPGFAKGFKEGEKIAYEICLDIIDRCCKFEEKNQEEAMSQGMPY